MNKYKRLKNHLMKYWNERHICPTSFIDKDLTSECKDMNSCEECIKSVMKVYENYYYYDTKMKYCGIITECNIEEHIKNQLWVNRDNFRKEFRVPNIEVNIQREYLQLHNNNRAYLSNQIICINGITLLHDSNKPLEPLMQVRECIFNDK